MHEFLAPSWSLPAAGCTLGADSGGAGGFGDMLFMIAIVGFIFYFLVIRPAGRERKEREQRMRNLKKHDRVVTNAGIYGTIVGMDEQTVTLRVDDKSNVRIRFSRAAIWQLEGGEGEAEGATKQEADAASA